MARRSFRRVLPGALLATALATAPAAGQRQREYRDRTIADLPRPGYQPRTITLGTLVLEPMADATVTYSDNILATPDRKVADAIVTVSPRVAFSRKSPRLTLSGDVYASAIRYVDNDRENVTTFGANVEAGLPLGTGQMASARVAFDRSFEGRSDPEAAIDRALPPALINIASGEARYAIQGARFGAIVSASVTQIDYLREVDADRDLMSYQASLRGSINAGRRAAFYVQPYVNRRSFRIPVTRTGVFGDTTTIGALGGVTFDLADRLQGDVGVGLFNANPDNPASESFYGVAANGRVIWQPRVRTAVTFEVSRGDVATIRAGALGRIDTVASLAIDQEVRHNLLLRVAGNWRQLHYRGGLDNDQSYLVGKVEGQYLFNRHLTGIVGADYVVRKARLANEEFNRFQATVGLRLAY